MSAELRMLAECVKARVGVCDVAAWFGFEYNPQVRNPCPICFESSSSRKTVQIDRQDDQRWWCHACNEGGDVIDWMAARLEVKKGAAITTLASRLGVSADPSELMAYLRSELSGNKRAELSHTGLCAGLLRAVRREFMRWSKALANGQTLDSLRVFEHVWCSLNRMADAGDRRAATLAKSYSTQASVPVPAEKPGHKMNGWAAQFYRTSLNMSRLAGRELYLKQAQDRGLMGHPFPGVGACMIGLGSIGELVRRRGMDGQPLIDAGILNRAGFDAMEGRLVFPIQDVLGRHLGFGGRLVQEREPGRKVGKYINTRDTKLFRKAHALYNIGGAFGPMVEAGWAVIVEGYTDVVALSRAGLDNSVASCGTGFTRHHAATVARWCHMAVVMMDGDEAGRRASERACWELRAAGVKPVPVTPPQEMDPDEWVAVIGDHVADEVAGAINRANRGRGGLGWAYQKLARMAPR